MCMCQIGFKCSVYGDVLHDDCRKCAIDPERHKCQWDAMILENMREKKDPERKGIYSPTQLTGCFRKDVLMSGQEDYFTKPEDAWAMERGNIVHAYLANGDYPGALWTAQEERLFIPIKTKYGEIKYGGKPDLIIAKRMENDVIYAKLIDWKSRSEIKHEDLKPYDDHIMQINQYKYLIESDPELSHYLPAFHLPVVVDEMEIIQISMQKPRRFSSIQELKTRGKMTRRSEPKEYEEILLEKIPVLAREVMHTWIVERIEKKIETTLDNMPPPLWDTEDSFKCVHCPVWGRCHDIK